MEAVNKITSAPKETSKGSATGVTFKAEDKLAMGHMKYAQGLGASLRYANELRAVQQVGRLPMLKSSHLHEDVLRGRLGAGTGFEDLLNGDDF